MKSLISILVICAFLILPHLCLAAETGPCNGHCGRNHEAGGYVYIRLENGVWIAANSFAVTGETKFNTAVQWK